MFHLVTIEDKVRVAPGQFNNEIQTIEDEIEKRYTNKISLGGGLFIALYDILGTGDSYVYSGDGGAHLMVRFRMIAFKPFVGEIMEGVIKKSSPDVCLNCVVEKEEGLWYWEYNDNHLFFEDGGRVRFRVDTVEFNPEISQPPPRPKVVNTDLMDAKTLKEHKEREAEIEEMLKNMKSPFVLKVSMQDSGLGMVSWWNQNEEEEEEPDQQDEDKDDGGGEGTAADDDEDGEGPVDDLDLDQSIFKSKNKETQQPPPGSAQKKRLTTMNSAITASTTSTSMNSASTASTTSTSGEFQYNPLLDTSVSDFLI
eukprot:gene11828-14468_t